MGKRWHLSFVVALMASAAFAGCSSSARLSSPSSAHEVEPDKEYFFCDISIVSDGRFSAYTVEMSYNPEVVCVSEVLPGDTDPESEALEATVKFDPSTFADGRTSIMSYSLNSSVSKGTAIVARIVFHRIVPGDADVSASLVSLYDAHGKPVAGRVVAGKIVQGTP